MEVRLFKEDDAFELSSMIQKTLREVNANDYSEASIQEYIDLLTPQEMILRSTWMHLYVVELDGMIGKDTNMKFKSRWSDLIPSGAWSDDTSMIYSTMDAIVASDGKIDNNKIMQSFVDWWEKGKYCSLNLYEIS